MTTEPKKDIQTTTSDDAPILKLINGVRIQPAATLHDERGTLSEILSPAWALNEAPIPYVYQFTIRPGENQRMAPASSA